ncbi:MAG: hypothetical protein GOMPHAMPRED_004378 [Gomphillus americanus]|uniref:Uncharacterized protein n=1 Tax=Gomphillus americanus TaxID=1940652 RepID=A0A8H3FQV1_9LECA|nr:MAG: hypothetical protein GOMPHAMPRED_004378 [Gomphillus americanus]
MVGRPWSLPALRPEAYKVHTQALITEDSSMKLKAVPRAADLEDISVQLEEDDPALQHPAKAGVQLISALLV